MEGKRLVIMRHAAAAPTAPTDAERALTPKGRATALEAGVFLRSIEFVPQLALVSPALRCRETWDLVEEGLVHEPSPTVRISDELYASAPESMLEVLRAVPESVSSVLLIGHNPSVAYLASVLADADGPIEVMQQLLNGLLPGAFAAYEPHVAWSELDMLTARLTHFHDSGAR